MTNLITSSFGKKYNNEKACISLTSWKARINTVGLTIYNLLTVCPGFHIVLTLSEEEFPKKEAELPVDLVKMAAIGLYEIIWVKKNYKAFKKVLFTMDKYRTVPVISADDDCLYKCNYAERYYNTWINNKDAFVSCYVAYLNNTPHCGGAATLYPPYVFGPLGLQIMIKTKLYTITNQDDDYYTALRSRLGLTNVIQDPYGWKNLYMFHDEICPTHNEIIGLSSYDRNELTQLIFTKTFSIL